MSYAELKSRCECQAVLSAFTDESLRVSGGSATLGVTMRAPATRVRQAGDQFQVGWLCPICGRNTLRSFFKGALRFELRGPERAEN